MRSPLSITFSLWLCLFGAMPALAEAPEPLVQRWSEIIWQTLPDKQLEETLKTREASARRAGTDWLGLSSLNLLREENPNPEDFLVRNRAVSLSFPLKVFRQKRVFDRVADAYARQAEVWLDFLRWQARGIARELINQLGEQQIRARAAKRQLQQARKLYDLVEQQVAAGERNALDKSLATQQLSQSQAQWVTAHQALKTQWLQAASWGIAMPEDEPELMRLLTIDGSTPDDPPNLPAITEDWLTKHPLYRWQQAQWQSAITEARQGWWEAGNSPILEIGRSREKAFDDPEATVNSISLSLPLGRSPSARLARARWQTAQTEAQIRQNRLQLDLQRQWRQARAKWEQARQLLAPAQKQWQAAQRALNMTRQSWQQGEASLRDVLLAQQAALEAQLATELAWHQLTVARRTLQHASGE